MSISTRIVTLAGLFGRRRTSEPPPSTPKIPRPPRVPSFTPTEREAVRTFSPADRVGDTDPCAPPAPPSSADPLP